MAYWTSTTYYAPLNLKDISDLTINFWFRQTGNSASTLVYVHELVNLGVAYTSSNLYPVINNLMGVTDTSYLATLKMTVGWWAKVGVTKNGN